MRRPALLVVVGTWLLGGSPAAAEITVGINGGFVIPGDQDLSFKEYPTDGGQPSNSQIASQKRVTPSVGPLVGVQATAWAPWSFLRYFGLQGDALYWHTSAKGQPGPPAPNFTVSQDRIAFFGSLVARVPVYPELGTFSPEVGKDWFVYGGAGLGPAYGRVSHGSSDWNPAYQFLGGISVPLYSQLRLRVEARYLVTSDVDTTPKDGPGWRVDVSGTRSGLAPDRHKDTRFVPVIFGLDWRF